MKKMLFAGAFLCLILSSCSKEEDNVVNPTSNKQGATFYSALPCDLPDGGCGAECANGSSDDC